LEPNTPLESLFERYVNNTCTEHEINSLLQYFGSANEADLRALIKQALNEADSVVIDRNEHLSELFINIKKNIPDFQTIELPVRHTSYRWYWASAAAVLLIACSVVFVVFDKNKLQQVAQRKALKEVIVPGGNKATLTLADGSKIMLDDATKGEIAEQAGISITKTADGQIVYTTSNSNSEASGSKLTYNTIETPIGGQYQINLPDGTKVWLNAASSLKYPTQFAANERRVELTGEGYFEVAKKGEGKKIPFIVKTASQTVEVLGTHFNINSYMDENCTKTTLLEGSVRVSQNATTKLLHPGQQSIVKSNSFEVEKVDIESEIAWKNGYFDFKEDIESIMKKLSRWYDIHVVYKMDKDPSLMFGGKVSRSKNIYAVLSIIEETGNVHFKVEGRRVTVMK